MRQYSLFYILLLAIITSVCSFSPSNVVSTTHLWRHHKRGLAPISFSSINDVPSDNEQVPSLTFLQRIRRFNNNTNKNKEEDSELSVQQRLAKLGLAAVLSYGWVSNMSYTVTVSVAWYIFSKQTGLSPLAPGQWKGFLAVYAGFWVMNNFLRPARAAVAVAISPQFDSVVAHFQFRCKVSKRVAIAITVIVANLIGTTVLMGVGILLAGALAGVPVFPGKL